MAPQDDPINLVHDCPPGCCYYSLDIDPCFGARDRDSPTADNPADCGDLRSDIFVHKVENICSVRVFRALTPEQAFPGRM
jgi:hypothetical protein